MFRVADTQALGAKCRPWFLKPYRQEAAVHPVQCPEERLAPDAPSLWFDGSQSLRMRFRADRDGVFF